MDADFQPMICGTSPFWKISKIQLIHIRFRPYFVQEMVYFEIYILQLRKARHKSISRGLHLFLEEKQKGRPAQYLRTG